MLLLIINETYGAVHVVARNFRYSFTIYHTHTCRSFILSQLVVIVCSFHHLNEGIIEGEIRWGLANDNRMGVVGSFR